MKTRSSSLFAGLVVVAALALVLIAFLHQQRIIDYVRGWQYESSAEMVALRQKLDLTSEGEFYFKASQPQLQPAREFNHYCRQDQETNNPILGCYVSQQIYIFDIDNPQLKGIEATTAAHELLHAVYDRMSEDKKATIHKQLQAAYERVKTPKLAERMGYYQQAEPGQKMNELYAILGSEESDVGKKLEHHYASYFNDRAAIVAYHNAYSSVFASSIGQIKKLEKQINTMTERINQRIADYNQAVEELEADAAALQRRANDGAFTSQAEFNAAQNELLARQDKLDAERRHINEVIEEVKVLRQQYNALVSEYNQLSQSINSSLTPIPTLQ